MSEFADASAVVKRYADEPGSELAREHAEAIVSALSQVEVTSALWRKHRLGELEVVEVAASVQALRMEWAALTVVPVGNEVLGRAARVVARHPLRAGDAIQLASAVLAREADPECDTMLCFDDRLRDAAAIEGFALLP